MAAPWTRKTKGLWLPPQTDDAAPPAIEAADTEQGTAETGQPHQSDADDELDRLTAHYAAEAEASNRSTRSSQPATQKGAQRLREEGLATPLAADNKGFKLLARMGYKPGQGLGASARGRTAPLDVDLKATKNGLGIDEEKKRRQIDAAARLQDRANKRHRLVDQDKHIFLEASNKKFSTVAAERHIATAQKTIETLDSRNGVPPHHMWLPPPSIEAAEADAADAEAEEPHPWQLLPAEQRLADVLAYLRDRYSYCLFCGCQYDREDDMMANCPGPSEDDH